MAVVPGSALELPGHFASCYAASSDAQLEEDEAAVWRMRGACMSRSAPLAVDGRARTKTPKRNPPRPSPGAPRAHRACLGAATPAPAGPAPAACRRTSRHRGEFCELQGVERIGFGAAHTDRRLHDGTSADRARASRVNASTSLCRAALDPVGEARLRRPRTRRRLCARRRPCAHRSAQALCCDSQQRVADIVAGELVVHRLEAVEVERRRSATVVGGPRGRARFLASASSRPRRLSRPREGIGVRKGAQAVAPRAARRVPAWWMALRSAAMRRKISMSAWRRSGRSASSRNSRRSGRARP